MSRPKERAAARRQLRIRSEREALHQVLLAATAQLARNGDARSVLQATCSALCSASSRIRLAWISLREAGADSAHPACAAGDARGYVDALLGGDAELQRDEPIHRCECEGPSVVNLRSDRRRGWRGLALQCGLKQVACFPFRDSTGLRGALGLYADAPNYFDQMGLEPFVAFAQLCASVYERAALVGRLERLAQFDELTELFNCSTLRNIVQREHASAVRSRSRYALVLFDIDRFKVINDSYGHATGDRVLREVARRAQEALRQGDWLGRWGGEEFLAFLPDTAPLEAAAVAERIRLRVATGPIPAEGGKLSATISAGIACYPRDSEDPAALLNTADAALYEAKRGGRNRTCGGGGGVRGIFSVASAIEWAMQHNALRPAHQPIIELATGRLVAEEVLARIVTEKGQVLDAQDFIDAASQLQLVHRIDHQMFRYGLARCRQHFEAGQRIAQFINLSADLLRHPDLLGQLIDTARQECKVCCGMGEGGLLVVEITEREFIDAREARRRLSPLCNLGVRLAIDDFGSGYSSFQYLSDLPIRYLKIEGSLVRRARHERRVRSILQGIRDIAKELGLITLAECVEAQTTVTLLREVGIDWGQGYYFARPVLDDERLVVSDN